MEEDFRYSCSYFSRCIHPTCTQPPHKRYFVYKLPSFTNFLRSQTWPRRTKMLMDNVSLHRTSRVREIADAAGWIILYTPPYSPWFDPIENVFGCVKNSYRRYNYPFYISGHTPNEHSFDMVCRAFDTSATPNTIMASFCHVDRRVQNTRLLLKDERCVKDKSAKCDAQSQVL